MSNPSPLPDPIGEIQQAWERATPGEWWRADRVNEVKERVYDLWAGTLPLGTLWGDNAVWLPEGQGEGQNADFAIAAHNHWPAVSAHLSTLAATVERLEAERARLARWMNPLVRLSLGLDYHECKIVDVGHSEIVLMIECPDAAEQLASVTSERDAALAEVGRLAAIVERLTTAGVPAIEMLGAFMPTGNDDASLKLKRDLADVANGLASASAAALAPTPERTEPNEAR